MEKIQFDYFRGMEADQYSFYRVPKILFTAECFRSLSCEAKVLYGLLLDRMSLSIRNRWFDEEDRVYIIFTVDEIAELLNCGVQKAVKLLKELDSQKGIGLIEKKRLGLGRPNVIYVKNFIVRDVAGSEVEKKEGSQHDQTGEAGRNHIGFTGNAGKKPESRREEKIPAGSFGQVETMPGNRPEKWQKGVEKPVNMQNCENHNSRISKITIQEFPESQFRDCENHHSGIVKTTIQELPESQFRDCENHHSGIVKTITQEFPKSQSNDTDINDTDCNDTEGNKTELNETGRGIAIQSNLSYPQAGATQMEEMDTYRCLIRQNIGYGAFRGQWPGRQEEVDELVELMVEVLMMPDESTLRVAGTEKPAAVVKSRFLRIGYEHIEYALECLRKNTTKVGNIKAYLLTVLYNSTLTIGNYYQAEVNHDMYGG